MKLPPRIQAWSPSLPTQTKRFIASVSSARMLAVPSFIPIRLRGVSWLRLVVEVRPKPSWDQRIATVPRPIRARLRIAWKATWGSSEQAWTQTSPPLSSWLSSSAGSGGIWRSAAGRFEARPRPRLSNSPGPKPKVTVRLEGSRPTVSPVSSGGASCTSLTSPISSPAVISAAASDHSRISSRSSAGLSVSRSKEAKWRRSWAGVSIPAWCSPP